MATRFIEMFGTAGQIPADKGSTAGGAAAGGGAAGIGVVNGTLVYSRTSTRTAGSQIGLQVKPNQSVANTNDVIGAEFSPRTAFDIGALIALRADPVLQTAAAARTVSAVRGLEVNIDFPDSGSAYTITNDVSAIRVYPDFGSGHTFSGVKAIMEIGAPNTSNFDVFLEIETGNATWVSAPGNTTFPTNAGKVKVRIGGTTYAIPVYEDE